MVRLAVKSGLGLSMMLEARWAGSGVCLVEVATVMPLVEGWVLSGSKSGGGDVCLSAGVERGCELATDRVAELRRRGNGERGGRAERVRLLDLDVACESALVGMAGKAE